MKRFTESPLDARIIVVDDDPGTVLVLANILKGLGKVYLATRPGEAVSLALQVKPDLVLLDVEMPDADGFAVLKELRTHAQLADTLVLFVTSHGGPDIEARALSAGAIDFINKPVQTDIVRARVSNYLTLKQQGDQLRRWSMLDGLTGIANRRAFDLALDQEWERAEKSGEPLGLVLCDIDYFKLYNDLYGHPTGDACLQSVAAVLRDGATNPYAVVARYGGEEFALLLPGIAAADAAQVAERLCAAVSGLDVPHAGSQVSSHVTLSLGVATHTPMPGLHPGVLVRAADEALYQAKDEGRNRVVLAGS
ncbi:MAG: diguanylate cyclase [Synechococcaceae cyanobacterium ELA739]